MFDLKEPEIFIQSYLMTGTDYTVGTGGMAPLSISGKSVRAVPQRLAERFGSDFYSHQHYSGCLDSQNEEEWKLRLEGQLFETGDKLQVTAFDELKRYITQQLSLGRPEAEVSQNA